MQWWAEAERLRDERRAAVVVTVVSVRGHAPRRSGAKMLVTPDATIGSVGGGNLEATAIERARELMRDRSDGRGIVGATVTPPEPELITLRLNDRAEVRHGVQCCGGEVVMLLEPVHPRAAVAIFGVGHVGLELARILNRLDVEVHLVDSRAAMLDPERLAVLDDGDAVIQVHHAPAPEAVIAELPVGTHALIMTHDHAEDLALCDVALRSGRLGSIGLIGSRGKWSRFRTQLAREGHSDEALQRIRTPIGVDGITSKAPAAIAVSCAAELLRLIDDAADADAPRDAHHDDPAVASSSR